MLIRSLLILLGIAAWWLIITKISPVDPWRPLLTIGLWAVITITFLLLFLGICFL